MHDCISGWPMASESSRNLRLAIAFVLRRRAAALLGAAGLVVGSAPAAELPVPCAAGTCGVPGFVTSGQATAVASGAVLNVHQQSSSAILNWQSFNISRDATVNFQQPDAASVAINRIHDAARPSTIAGALNANGQVYLLNRNGIIFNDGAQVNVGGLVASSLNLTPAAIERGLAGAIDASSAAFERGPGLTGSIRVENGATINAPGGQVLLFAPDVSNHGTIRTPDGQTILGSGDSVFLAASTDQQLRGLYVEVRGEGRVTNGEAGNAGLEAAQQVGRIVADRGNVTLVGSLVRQQGQVSATTSTRANGSVRLLARTVSTQQTPQADLLRTQELADIGGTLAVGANSSTSVTLDASDNSQAVDVNAQPRSRVQMSGRLIEVGAASAVTATAGDIDIAATRTPNTRVTTATADDSSLVIASDARLDVSGASVELPVERNVLRVELRGSQLADSPLQREGALRSDAIFVDVRESGTRADGTRWIGAPLADLSGDISNIRRGLAERNLSGGTINLQSQGAVVVGSGAQLDVSGGFIDWQSGYVNTSQLLGADGRIYDIANADRDRTYLGVANAYSLTDRRWGVTHTYYMQGIGQSGRFEAGYLEGRDAGSVSVVAPRAILDGTVVGHTVIGSHQRNDQTGTAARASYFDLIPRAAQLTIGLSAAGDAPDHVTGRVEVGGGGQAPAGVRTLQDAAVLLGGVTATRVRADLPGEGGVGELRIFANEGVRISSDQALQLPDNGTLAVTAGRIDVDTSIASVSGTLTLRAEETTAFRGSTPQTTQAIEVADGVRLDVRGNWVNEDRTLVGNDTLAALHTDGGSIALSVSNGPLDLGAGSVLDVSAGARRRADGSIVAGAAGSIALTTLSPLGDRPSVLALGGELRGAALERGGSVSITAPSICISGRPCAGDPAALALDVKALLDGGFESISLAANLGNLTLAGGTTLALQQRNLELLDAHRTARSGSPFDALARPAVLPDHLRRPVNLSLGAGYDAGQGFVGSGDLRMEAGAAILGDPLAHIRLATDSSMFLDGSIRSVGGDVTLAIDASNRAGVRPDQGLWLGADAVIDVSGATIATPSSRGLALGSVLDGGSVTVDLARGFLVTQVGSRIDASGTSGALDLYVGSGRYERSIVASAGGSIALASADGMQLNGSLRAASGAVGEVRGGELTIKLDAQRRVPLNPQDGVLGDRTVLVTAQSAPVVLEPGAALPDTLQGLARVSADAIEEGAFDFVTLAATNVVTSDPVTSASILQGYGRVELESGVELAARGSLILDAAAIGMAGGSGTASLASSHVGLTRTLSSGSGIALERAAPAAVAGNGALTIDGNLIDLFGDVTLTGLKSAALRSSGDIRGRGVLNVDSRQYAGRLRSTGTLTLEAQQIYPSTLADFTFAMTGGDDDSIRVRGVAGERDPVLSAGGTLRLDAPSIDISGTLRAPLGEIDLSAQRLSVGAGGVLSTSLDGETVPLGTTQGGLAWAYALTNEVTRIFGPGGESLPEQRIVLDAASVDLAAGSTIDVSGGGDLLAYEFVPGPGGSRDVLSSSVRPNQFAILPGADPAFAPFDPNESAGVNLRPGDTIWLGTGSGVPEGVYTLLPARYALLPGAYLVEAVGGYQDIRPGDSYATLAGASIVAGRRGVSGTNLFDSRTSGFRIRPGTNARVEARYDLSNANEFFTRAPEDLVSTSLPRDAGTVTLLATASLALEGTLRAATGEGGRGATLEISAPSLSIVGEGQSAAPGSLAVRASQLSALGAQRLLIGGRRTRGADGETITAEASEVTVEEGVTIASPEIVLAANDALRVRGSATIDATGARFTGDEALTVSAGASFLRASTSDQVAIARSTVGGGAGVLEIAAGALVRAPGSVTVDVGSSAITHGTFEIGAGSLALGADLIGLGRTPDGYAGVAVDPGSLGSIAEGSLELRARTALDLFSGTDFIARTATLSTPLIRAGSPDVDARFDIGRLTLLGSEGAATVPSAGSAALSIAAEQIELGGGALRLDGFAASSMSAHESIEATGSGSLRTAGDLALTAGLITANAATDYEIAAARNLQLGVTDAAMPAQAAQALGAHLSFSGAEVSGDARIRAAAGQIVIAANGAAGNIALGSQTLLDVSGRAVRFDDVDIAASGGTIRLDSISGSVRVAPGASLNVSAARSADARAGALRVTARDSAVDLGATLAGGAARRQNGGSVAITANAFSFDQLRTGLSSGEFTGDWTLWLRGTGDLSLASGQTIAARSVALTADSGSIGIAGAIDASTPRGGHVTLAASGPIEITGTVSAAATDADVRGGRVEVFSGAGVVLGPSARIDVSGTALSDPALERGGLVSIRAPRAAFASVLDADAGNDALSLRGTVSGARRVVLEGFERYTLNDGQVTDTSTGTQWYADAQVFSADAAGLAQALGVADDARFSIRPGVELVADVNALNEQGTLALLSDWNLHDWRFGSANALPGVLTLRAAGDVRVNASISDGFTAADSFALAEDAGESWSYRLAAGADLASANPLATRRMATASDAVGSVVIAQGTPGTSAAGGQQRVVRTGTGSIDIAAAADLVLGNEASVIYTAGASGPGVRIPEDTIVGGLGSRAYPINGGDLSIDVGRDVNASPATQLYSDWLLRSGAPDAVLPTSTAWTVAFDYFEQGIGTLGGGNVAVTAGRDIRNLSASTPSIGRQIGGVLPQQSVLQIVGGGDLTVRAEGSIVGGQFFADRGIGHISAGDAVSASPQTGLAPVIALGDAALKIEARRSAELAAAVSPTLLIPVDPVFGPLTSGSTYFSNYTDDSSLSVLAVGGELRIGASLESLSARYPSHVNSDENPALFAVLPPTFTAAALSDSLTMQKGAPVASLWPAARGNLQLFAREDIRLEPLLMSDAPLGTALPTPQSPQSEPQLIANVLARSGGAQQPLNAPAPVHDGDPEPARIVALSGDVIMAGEGAQQLYVPKPLRLSAGRDVAGLNTRIQHFDAANVSTITAGRDITFPSVRDANGRLERNLGEISIDGPGTLQLIAGRHVDLQTSSGIVSQGNLRNPALPALGADISVMAGLAAREPAYDAMIERYLQDSDTYDELLLDYIETTYRRAAASKQEALTLFEQLSRASQRPLLQSVLFAEIRSGGRAAAEAGAGHSDFTRAFTALETFFPGATPDPDAGEANPYAGDVRLFFSRVYTLAGGDINLLAPGGEINVGLAAPPLSFGIQKDPSDLGIVVQSSGDVNALSYRDYQVNESRTFAADGGSILVWSTRGDIDAGRGAKTAISAPPPVISVDPNGQVRVTFPAALSGSGIQTLATSAERKPGNVDLFAPRGVVNASDAGIVAGNLTIAATAVLGTDNIEVSGVAVGVPVETSGLGASLANASSVASSASAAAAAVVEPAAQQGGEQASLAQAALSWLEVFVVGLGEENCRPDDLECLKRQE